MNKTELRYRFFHNLIKCVAHLPLRALYILSDLACLIIYKVVKYRVEVVRKNLSMVFPEKSERERLRIEKEFYRHLPDIFVETAKLAHISDKEIARRVEIEGIEVINNAVESGKSVILMLGHYGNWEWVTSSAPEMDKRAVLCEIYHRIGDKAFDRVMLDLRSRFGTENIPMAKSVRRLLRIHRDGGQFVCGFIADQRPFSRELKHWTDFLGLDTAYVNGGEAIGTKIGAEFVYASMMPLKRGYYRLTFKRLLPLKDGGENPYTRAFLKELESTIRQTPPYWLWSHNRWKRKRGE